MRKILYLYAELAPYVAAVLKQLTISHNALVEVVHWDKKKLKPYVAPAIEGVTLHSRSELNDLGIREIADVFQPELVVISGWMDKGYFPTALTARKRGIPVVTCFDDQWLATNRQQLGSIYFRLFLRKFFSHAWVAGPRQFEFAKRLGFENSKILFDLLTCDYERFDSFSRHKSFGNGRFLYVGNFRSVKGTDILVEAFKNYRNSGGTWDLTCVGNGNLTPLLSNIDGLQVLPYLDQESFGGLCSSCDVFILPSRLDQWGVVAHEFAAAGFPLLLADRVGASSTFLINGLNGLAFESGSVSSLADSMHRISKCTIECLSRMGKISSNLAARITPETSAANLISALQS